MSVASKEPIHLKLELTLRLFDVFSQKWQITGNYLKLFDSVCEYSNMKSWRDNLIDKMNVGCKSNGSLSQIIVGFYIDKCVLLIYKKLHKLIILPGKLLVSIKLDI